MNTKNILIGTVSVIATFLLLFVVYKFTNTPTQTYFPETNQVRPDDHTKWKSNQKNILTEYSDLQCPACRNFYLFLKDFEKTATPNATFVFRNFPLYQIHPHAYEAAYAAEAAGIQGKFWEMESLIYEKQPEWENAKDVPGYFVNLAKGLNLNIEKFKKDANSDAVKNMVANDLAEGEKIGINSTPTFFLNGKQVTANSYDEFKKLLLSL